MRPKIFLTKASSKDFKKWSYRKDITDLLKKEKNSLGKEHP